MNYVLVWLIAGLVLIGSLSVVYDEKVPRWAAWLSHVALLLVGAIMGFYVTSTPVWWQKLLTAIFWAVVLNLLVGFMGWVYRLRLRK